MDWCVRNGDCVRACDGSTQVYERRILVKLHNLIIAASLFGIVDIVDDNMIAVEVSQAGVSTVIHADTTGTGCVFKEGEALPIIYEDENNFVITCKKVLDTTPRS